MRYVTVLLVALMISACAPNYSDGSRVGVVTKLSYTGLMFKSWEGEMLMGGLRQQTDEHGNTSSVANIFEFNVDPSVVEQVKAAQSSGKPVQLAYTQWFMHPLTIGHSYVIVSVKEPQ